MVVEASYELNDGEMFVLHVLRSTCKRINFLESIIQYVIRLRRLSLWAMRLAKGFYQ